MREDDEQQEELGTLAPIELTRAKALESSSRFDFIQAQGLYKQQELILRNQILRTASPVFASQFEEIVPTDHITVPDQLEPLDVSSLVAQGLSQRPDLAQASLQVVAGKISANASRNAALPQLNLYANAETRGASEQPYEATRIHRHRPRHHPSKPRPGRPPRLDHLSGRRPTNSPATKPRRRLRRRTRHHSTPPGPGPHRKNVRTSSRRYRDRRRRLADGAGCLSSRFAEPRLPIATPGRRARQTLRRPVDRPRRSYRMRPTSPRQNQPRSPRALTG